MARISQEDQALLAELRANGLYAEAEDLEAALRSEQAFYSPLEDDLAQIQEFVDANDRDNGMRLYQQTILKYRDSLMASGRPVSKVAFKSMLTPGRKLTFTCAGSGGFIRPVQWRTVKQVLTDEVELLKEDGSSVSHLELPKAEFIRLTDDGFFFIEDDNSSEPSISMVYLWGHLPKDRFVDFFGRRKTAEDVRREEEQKREWDRHMQERQDRARAEEESERLEKQRFAATTLGQYLSTMTPLRAGKVKAYLEKLVRNKNYGVVTLAKLVENAVSEGSRIRDVRRGSSSRSGDYKEVEDRVLEKIDGSGWWESDLGKGAFAYAEWLIARRDAR